VRIVFAASILAAPLLSAFHAMHLIRSGPADAWLPILLGSIGGALAADLATGLVHWACDTWGSERTPWFGPSLIRSFREHHRDPKAMLDHDWIEVNGEAAAAAGVALLALASPAAQSALVGRPFAYALVWATISLAALANQLHLWSHAPEPPGIVRALQRRGLMLSPVRHARHHRRPHTTGYCISTGWLNPALDAAGFWRALERAVTALTGAEPRSDEAVRRRGSA
jgi:ubiquitin-conjugating enzyme E2 variant